jgi:hypothetical protein
MENLPMITAIISVMLAASSPSADVGSNEAPGQSQPKPRKPKKICRSIAKTGSRITKSECKTQEQWDQAEYAAELSVKGAQGTTQPPQFPTGG